MIDLILVSLSLILISTSGGNPLFKSIGNAFLIIVGTTALIASALLYIGSFKFGFTRTMRAAILVILILVVATPAVASEVATWMFGSNISNILNIVRDFNWFILGFSGLFIYAGLMAVAVRVKSSSCPESYL